MVFTSVLLSLRMSAATYLKHQLLVLGQLGFVLTLAWLVYPLSHFPSYPCDQGSSGLYLGCLPLVCSILRRVFEVVEVVTNLPMVVMAALLTEQMRMFLPRPLFRALYAHWSMAAISV